MIFLSKNFCSLVGDDCSGQKFAEMFEKFGLYFDPEQIFTKLEIENRASIININKAIDELKRIEEKRKSSHNVEGLFDPSDIEDTRSTRYKELCFDESSEELSEDPDTSIENETAFELKQEKLPEDIMYNDFFDPPGSGEDKFMHEQDSVQESENDELSVPFDPPNDDGPDDLPNTLTENNLSQNSKTSFELEQEKIKRAIENYEDALVQKPEWHLTGEVAANSRPKDSLLHQYTEFDVNAKPVLIEDNTLIEKAIKTIIKNKAFSNGERIVKRKDITTPKQVLLEQMKSKKSLSAIYEEEYLKKKYVPDQENQEDPKHEKINKMMGDLFPALEALFCHIPKPAIPDIKIISHLPAITVEEVAPTSISDMTLLAPEEIKKKSGLIKNQTEKNETDRKRERRKKKILQKKKFKKMQTESDKNPKNVKSKLEKLKTLKQHRNTKISDMENKKIKSSKDFFTRLQELSATKLKRK